MEQITQFFTVAAKFGAIAVVLFIIGFALYVRWRAAGQERGI